MVRFEEELKPETTYSINFGNAIKDLHEGNILKTIHTFFLQAIIQIRSR